MTVQTKSMLAVAAAALLAMTGPASAKSGPVSSACAREIKSCSAGKSHGDGAVRSCLEGQRAKLSDGCKAALAGTGGGKGRGRNRG